MNEGCIVYCTAFKLLWLEDFCAVMQGYPINPRMWYGHTIKLIGYACNKPKAPVSLASCRTELASKIALKVPGTVPLAEGGSAL